MRPLVTKELTEHAFDEIGSACLKAKIMLVSNPRKMR
jgi:hypothetical protein